MHEVGHSLGLRHNFKASIMLRPDQINDTSITHLKGMTGSVMDYNPINIAPKGQKQGDYASTTIGPYDYWAIEYAYKPIEGDESAELKKIAARSPDPDLAFGTDDDFADNDPQINTYDLTNDTLAYGKQRIAMATELLKDLDQKVVRDNESWSRLRSAFSSCISQFGNGAYLASEYIGGQSVNRDFKGTEKARDPIIPISGAKQREALQCWSDQILSDKAFQFSPALLRKLITESWQDSRFYSRGGRDYPIYRMILNLQEIVLDQCLDSSVLQRIQNQELQSDPGHRPHQDRRDLPLALRWCLLRALRAGRRLGTVHHFHHPPQPSARIYQAAEHMVLGPRTTASTAWATAISSSMATWDRHPPTPRTWRGSISTRSARRSTS